MRACVCVCVCVCARARARVCLRAWVHARAPAREHSYNCLHGPDCPLSKYFKIMIIMIIIIIVIIKTRAGALATTVDPATAVHDNVDHLASALGRTAPA